MRTNQELLLGIIALTLLREFVACSKSNRKNRVEKPLARLLRKWISNKKQRIINCIQHEISLFKAMNLLEVILMPCNERQSCKSFKICWRNLICDKKKSEWRLESSKFKTEIAKKRENFRNLKKTLRSKLKGISSRSDTIPL